MLYKQENSEDTYDNQIKPLDNNEAYIQFRSEYWEMLAEYYEDYLGYNE